MDHQKYVELYGGIIADAPSASEADMAPTQAQGKKAAKRSRRKSTKSPESDGVGQKGRRGRPRVDTQDESAVEVRKPISRRRQISLRIASPDTNPTCTAGLPGAKRDYHLRIRETCCRAATNGQ